jgi:hypothetical protein
MLGRQCDTNGSFFNLKKALRLDSIFYLHSGKKKVFWQEKVRILLILVLKANI